MLDLLFKRRSIRKFTEQPIEQDKLDRILQAALLAPSSKSKYPCEFIVIDNKDSNEKLSECKPHGASFLKAASASIVIAGDIDKSDVWVEDCSIAAAYIQLQAEKEDIGSCWIQIRERPHDIEKSSELFIQEHLNMPANIKILAIIALGYKEGEKKKRDTTHLKTEKIHKNSY